MKDRASSMKRAPSERPLPHSLVHLDPAEPRCKLRTRCGAMRVPVCPVCVRNHTQTQTHIHIHINTSTSHTKAGPAGGGVPAPPGVFLPYRSVELNLNESQNP